MKITLDDVAKEAGVSRATVDRVLNKRGNVKEATVDRVFRALYSTRYLIEPEDTEKPPSSYIFDFVFPVAKTKYFETFAEEIKNFGKIFASMKAEVRVHTVVGFDPQVLADKLLEVGENTDGIAFVALDHPIVRDAVRNLSDQGIGVISLVSDISSQERLAYVGIDNRSAGRTAGLLMGRFLTASERKKVAVFVGSHSYRGHEEREAGFKSMIRERFPRFRVLEMPEVLDDDAKSLEHARELLAAEKDLACIYNVGGGTLGIAQALEESGHQDDIVFVAHELNDATRRLLVNGTLDAVINQDIKQEVYSAVDILLNYKLGDELMLGVQQPKVEIYLSENIY
jgi:LacI family transcriptional regulator